MRGNVPTADSLRNLADMFRSAITYQEAGKELPHRGPPIEGVATGERFDTPIEFERDKFIIERTAIEKKRMVFFPQTRNKLIHNTAIYPYELVLRLLAEFYFFNRIDIKIICGIEKTCGSDLESS